jgi:hypothetical protein
VSAVAEAAGPICVAARFRVAAELLGSVAVILMMAGLALL